MSVDGSMATVNVASSVTAGSGSAGVEATEEDLLIVLGEGAYGGAVPDVEFAGDDGSRYVGLYKLE